MSRGVWTNGKVLVLANSVEQIEQALGTPIVTDRDLPLREMAERAGDRFAFVMRRILERAGVDVDTLRIDFSDVWRRLREDEQVPIRYNRRMVVVRVSRLYRLKLGVIAVYRRGYFERVQE